MVILLDNADIEFAPGHPDDMIAPAHLLNLRRQCIKVNPSGVLIPPIGLLSLAELKSKLVAGRFQILKGFDLQFDPADMAQVFLLSIFRMKLPNEPFECG